VSDVLWKLGSDLIVGVTLGWLVRLIIYRLPSGTRLSMTGDGFIALGATLVVYTATEFAHGYGFWAVFVAGLMIRRATQGDDFNKRLHDFADESERLLMMLLLLLFGGMLAAGLLQGVGWQEVAFAAIMLLVIRPLAGWVSLIGVKRPKLELAIIAFFGIRGLGSVYLSELRLQPRDLPVEKAKRRHRRPYAPPSMQVRPSRPAERPLRRIRREASPPAGRIFSMVTPLGPLGGTRRSAAPPRFGCPGEYGRNDPRQPFAILGRADFALQPPSLDLSNGGSG
jgi:hypothetical protein